MTPEPCWFQLVFLEIAEDVRPFEDSDVALEPYRSLDDFDLEASHDLIWHQTVLQPATLQARRELVVLLDALEDTVAAKSVDVVAWVKWVEGVCVVLRVEGAPLAVVVVVEKCFASRVHSSATTAASGIPS